jgi:hypothetical protein
MKIKGYFPGRVKNNGYISPPLQIPRRDRNSGSTRWRIALLLCILLILYLCGFSVPGYRGGNKKVVIILAANLGGGNTPFWNCTNDRGVKCKKFWRLGNREVEHSE